MAELNVQEIDTDGLEVTFVAASATGDTFPNNTSQRTFLWVKRGSGGTDINVIVQAQKTMVTVPGIGELIVPHLTIRLSANSEQLMGPFTEAYINENGMIEISYAATPTNVTVAAIELPAQY